MRHEPSLLSTGVVALDELLGGGIPARQMLLIAGQPGSGKTLLAGQIAFAQAARGLPVLLATAASEPHTRMLESLQSFSFFQRERVGRDIFLLSVYSWLRKGPKETREMLLGSVRDRKARVLVLDGLRSLREVWRDETSVREFVAELGIALASNDCTAVFTLEGAPERVLELPEAATVDAVMNVSHERQGATRRRTVEVLKVRGRRHVGGVHAAEFGPAGLRVHRRIETLPLEAPTPLEGRTKLGIAGLDDALGGGVQAGTVTLVSGDEGTGKSTVAAGFAREGTPSLLACLGDAFPRPNGPGVALWAPSSMDLGPDEWAHELLEQRSAVRARRVVLDDVDVLADRVPLERAHGFWTTFLAVLGAGGVDVLLTRSRSSKFPAGLRVDNHLELRRLETRGMASTELWVLKARGLEAPPTAFDARVVDGRMIAAAFEPSGRGSALS